MLTRFLVDFSNRVLHNEYMKTLLGTEIETIHYTFWQRTSLGFVCILGFCVRLSLKVTEYIVQQRSFQISLVFVI